MTTATAHNLIPTLPRRAPRKAIPLPTPVTPLHVPPPVTGTGTGLTATVTISTPEVAPPPQIKQLLVRLIDGGTIPFRDYASYEIRDGVLYVFQRAQDTTERMGSRQVTVTATVNVMIPMNRVIRLEDKHVVPKG